MAAQDTNETRSVAKVTGDDADMRAWAEQLVARARAEGVELTGDDGPEVHAEARTVIMAQSSLYDAAHGASLRVHGVRSTPALRSH